MMKIETTGAVLTATCEVQTERCRARILAPVTSVWTEPARRQVNVCRPCLEEQVRDGEWEIPGARLSPRHDVAVLDAYGNPRLLIDVKSRPPSTGSAAEWARRVHHNLVCYAGLPLHASFMLVGFPDQFFGWAPDAARNPGSPPIYELRSAEVLAPFLHQAGKSRGGPGQERVVAAWVESFIASPPPGASGPAEWLAGSGLLDAVRNGTITRQVAAA